MNTEDGTCEVVDAELHVRSLGDGPPLLMISGGLGAAGSYQALATKLAEEYTVLLYDRRGHFESADITEGPIPVERHAEDARAVIRHFGFGKALVFGSSAGAQIGLALAAQHPETVDGLVAHEPPAVRLLPDAEEWMEFAAEQVAHAESGDVLTAFKGFLGSIAGAGLPTVGTIRLPQENEWRLLFTRELTRFYGYLPDVESLRRSQVPIVLAAGEGSRGYYHYRPARVLALELGLPFVEMPGAHLAPQRNAADFAVALSQLLRDLVL
ncbi:alpha/beta hydrolase [Amycolatopsis acidiphila]|uniref:Alpha/beta hydrolase n=1 Tax=Amycolatopsis acidiphila TaxID=715473 RepID=A0A558AF31_9PSEU|nr:alpha/beta hydrolase [Amycolatopsis acidiphila]TVT22833.1 alpha/beta hydrolase [Amycolatopsis acidiphila]UIJ58154.1 alpha/beta hydrolase [Amycolatopsis acidiphila]GHG69752.1 alpha/beta hydrolase [Amycolatopsis acidiphila]